MQGERCDHGAQKNCTMGMIFGALILLRIILSSRLPSYILAGMPHDDGWLVRQAYSILSGNWLGPYDQFTMIKGPFSPFFMAFAAQLGVSFAALNTFLYCFACLVFVDAIRPIIKSQKLQIISFAVLLFNPLTYSLEIGQRIYRNSLGQWQILIIFGCLIAIFIHRNQSVKSLLKWAILGGLTLGAFFNTREDSAWIYPFVFGSIGITILTFLVEKLGPKKKVVIYLVPLILAFLVTGAFALKNKEYYGFAIVNDRNGGNFAKVAGDLYAIVPDAADDALYSSGDYRGLYITLYVSTIEKAFLVSPTLNQISGPFRGSIKWWAELIHPTIGQPFTDHMLFALRDGARAAGYYRTVAETEAFYGKVHEELQTAFKNGKLKRHRFSISPLIKRVQISDFGKAAALMPGAIYDVVRFKDIESRAALATGTYTGIKKFMLTAGGDLYEKVGASKGQGWAFLVDTQDSLRAGLYDKNGDLLAPLKFEAGDYAVEAFNYPNVKVSRFSFDLKGYDHLSGVTFRFFNRKDKLVWQMPLDGVPACGGTKGIFHYCTIEEQVDDAPSGVYFGKLADRANQVSNLYKAFSSVFGVLGLISYLVLTMGLIREVRNKQVLTTLPAWILLNGIVLTFILFIVAMCLITVVSFNGLIYLYLAPAHILFLMFCVVSVSWGIQKISNYRKFGSL